MKPEKKKRKSNVQRGLIEESSEYSLMLGENGEKNWKEVRRKKDDGTY